MKKRKFSLVSLLKEVEKNENAPVQTQGAANVPQDPQMGQTQAQMPPEMSPQQVASQQPSSDLSDLAGTTISDASFERVGANGGKIVLKTSNSHVPAVISWVGSKVTFSKPDGTVIMLSKEGQ